MKITSLTGIRKFDIIEKPRPVIQSATDILVKINQVGVCGSDIHYFTTGRIGEQIIDFPFIVGHEAMGIIEEVGGGVEGLKKGQRIAIEPAVHCGECDQCKAGRMNTCRKSLFLGCPGQLNGALQEYMILQPQNCIAIDDQISDDEAVISEPMSIGVYTVKRSGISKGQSAAIMGYGPIGQSLALSLQAASIIPALVVERLNYRKELAKMEGIRQVLSPDNQNQFVNLETPGFDVVYECSGDQQAIYDGIQLLKPGGKLVIVGIPDSMEIHLPIHTLRRKEIDIINIRRQVGCVEESLELMKNKKIDIKNMATHYFGMEEVQKAFELVANYQDGVMKAMIKIP